MVVRILLVLALVHLGLLFAVAGLTKGLSASSFRSQLLDHHLLPTWSYSAVAWGLPGVEFSVGLMLLSGFEPRFSAAVATIMLCLFVAYRLALIRGGSSGDQPPCACFGNVQFTRELGSRAELVGVGVNLAIAATATALAAGEFAYSPMVSVVSTSVAVASFVVVVLLRASVRKAVAATSN